MRGRSGEPPPSGFLCPSAFSLLTLPPPAPPLLPVRLLHLFSTLPNSHAYYTPPSLPLSPREVLALLFSELFLESSQLTRLSITKSDKASLEPQAPFQLPSSHPSSAKAPQSPTCLPGPDSRFLPSGHPPHSAPGNFQGTAQSSTFRLPGSPLGLLAACLSA